MRDVEDELEKGVITEKKFVVKGKENLERRTFRN
jgi:hypothetical protein